MSWIAVAQHAWASPLEFAKKVAHLPEIALLYSGRKERFSGQYSFLFFEAAATEKGSDFSTLPAIPATADGSELPYWVGYIGYGMRLTQEQYQRQSPACISLPDFWLTAYRRLVRFDHHNKTIEEFSWNSATAYNWNIPPITQSAASVHTLQSNMTRAHYESIVDKTIEEIAAGNFYQANITRKFFGNFDAQPNAWDIFLRLCDISPAPYSAFIQHGTTAILSSSPECFLTVNTDGTIIARPIKGSAKRGATADEDTYLRNQLAASEKNIAENLMIVDLMRNDLSRVSIPTSVSVSERAALYSYATIHHLVSTITAKRLPSASIYDVLKAAFPPGSMTGAPKIAAIRWCEHHEPNERGVYSGVIGWFGARNTCDLSVVIRTLLIEDTRFEFQVGGGIVADSTAEDEWRETLIKARGIASALGICEEALAAL